MVHSIRESTTCYRQTRQYMYAAYENYGIGTSIHYSCGCKSYQKSFARNYFICLGLADYCKINNLLHRQKIFFLQIMANTRFLVLMSFFSCENFWRKFHVYIFNNFWRAMSSNSHNNKKKKSLKIIIYWIFPKFWKNFNTNDIQISNTPELKIRLFFMHNFSEIDWRTKFFVVFCSMQIFPLLCIINSKSSFTQNTLTVIYFLFISILNSLSENKAVKNPFECWTYFFPS